MRRMIAALMFVSLPLATVLTRAQNSTLRGPTSERTSIELGALDRSTDACTDFFQFACGGWIATHPIPADRGRYGRFDELDERNAQVLKTILETAAAGHDPSTVK